MTNEILSTIINIFYINLNNSGPKTL